MKKKLLILMSVMLVVVISAVSVLAATIIEYNGFSYVTLNGDYISICGWDNSSEALNIPAQLDGSYIKEIGDLGLKDNTYITSVDFSRAIYMTRIGRFSFAGCTGLSEKVSIPNRVNDVGICAFQGCSSITSADYYASTETVPEQCFYNCSSLNEVIISAGVTSISKLAFANCYELQSVRIPESVTYISPSAFNGDEGLVISCYTDSAAHQYAVDNGFEYILLDAPEPTEPPTDPPTDAPTEAPTDPATDPATEKPSTVPTEVTFILGDADGDGSISILDATKIQRVLASIDPDDDGMITLRGNVNDAKELNILHATKIQRFIAGYEVAEPIGTEVTRTIQVPVE